MTETQSTLLIEPEKVTDLSTERTSMGISEDPSLDEAKKIVDQVLNETKEILAVGVRPPITERALYRKTSIFKKAGLALLAAMGLGIGARTVNQIGQSEPARPNPYEQKIASVVHIDTVDYHTDQVPESLPEEDYTYPKVQASRHIENGHFNGVTVYDTIVNGVHYKVDTYQNDEGRWMLGYYRSDTGLSFEMPLLSDENPDSAARQALNRFPELLRQYGPMLNPPSSEQSNS